MIAEAAALDATPFTLQYELLRSQVVGARADAAQASAVGRPRPVGLALLLGEGMPGWLKAVEAVIRAALAPQTPAAADPPLPEHPAGCRSAPAWLSGVQRHDITSLLASLVLSTRPLERSSPGEASRSCP